MARPGMPSRSDIALGGLLGMATAAETASLGAGWPASAVACLPAVALVWRRALPLLVPTAVLVLILYAWAFDRLVTADTVSQVIVWILGAFATGAYLSWRLAVVGLGYWIAVLTVWMLIRGSDLADVAFVLVLITAPWAAGMALRNRREQAEEADRRAESAAATAVTAVADERARIARELHDVVAHAVGMMVVQAGAAAQVLDRDPSRARQSLIAIEQTGRLAVDELARMLAVLRMEEGTASPLPSLARLSELLSGVRGMGTAVSLRSEGDLTNLPAALDATAYRILQEALTNVVKHAPGATTEVRLVRGTDHVRIEVCSGPGSGTPQLGGTGHGLLGIGERAAAFDGQVQSGPTPEGGYRLSVRLPVDTVQPRVPT